MDPLSDPMHLLSDAWHTLRMSVQHPSRVRTWDAIVLTAASPDQAKLYQLQLERAKQVGVIARATIILAVPDPGSQRIGSGAATLHAIRSLSSHIASNRNASEELKIDDVVLGMHVLLLHTGGDSKRVPWANCIGKAFVPLPFLADEDPDASVPTLFDHILAISALALQAFSGKGGLLIMTGDVLPCFNASGLALPEDGVCVVTVPCALDLASKHGVILSSSWKKGAAPPMRSSSGKSANRRLFLVDDLLQKPSTQEMFNRGAVNKARRVLLDTGIFALHGAAWQDMIRLATVHPNPVDEVITSKTEISLYEEVAGAWVPARHAWLQDRPLGKTLIGGLGAQKLQSYCAYEMKFLHFGTSGECLDHLAVNYVGTVGRRHFSSISSPSESEVAATAVVLTCNILGGVSIGDESLVFDCTFGSGVHIGARCVVMNIHSNLIGTDSSTHTVINVPSWHCVWDVPLKRKMDHRVTLCCGIDDNPKAPYKQGGTFCRKPWVQFMSDLGIMEKDLWPSSTVSQDLWNAKLFPVAKVGVSITFALWMMGDPSWDKKAMLSNWRNCTRLSFEELHSELNFDSFQLEVSKHRAEIAAGFTKATVITGSMGRNLARLSLAMQGNTGLKILKELLPLCKPSTMGQVPASRAYQAQSDIHMACGDKSAAAAIEPSIWQAVALETERAVGTQTPGTESQSRFGTRYLGLNTGSLGTPSVRQVKVELPVRVDFMGGWSDTPPWSLERVGRVLNMAVALEGSSVVGAEVVVKDSPGVTLNDDAGNEASVGDLSAVCFPLDAEDPFRLIKAALIVMGITRDEFKVGLDIRTWANVPRGSGLGTSSILAVAVVKGLLTVTGGDLSESNVANFVLLVEQCMGTGGGWQDQIGGLYPGIKCTTSYPGTPLTFKVEPVELGSNLAFELEERMVLVFTGQVRLAHKVLEKVVRRYLQRDARVILSIKRLAELAKIGQDTLAIGDLDKFGALLCEAWKLNQELDPECSNPFVDSLFKMVAHLSCGYKLVGAGGGGFALILAKCKQTSKQIKEMMSEVGSPVKVYEWKIHSQV